MRSAVPARWRSLPSPEAIARERWLSRACANGGCTAAESEVASQRSVHCNSSHFTAQTPHGGYERQRYAAGIALASFNVDRGHVFVLYRCAQSRRANSAPQLGRIEPACPAALVPNRVHHLTRSSWPVTSLAIPQTDELDLFGSKAARQLQHPSVVALVRVFSLSERAEFVWSGVENGGRLHGEISGAPIVIVKIDRPLKEGSLVERDEKFETCAAPEGRFGEENITAACAPADRDVPRSEVDIGHRSPDGSRCGWLFVGRKARLLTAGSVYHVAAEYRDLWGLILACTWRSHPEVIVMFDQMLSFKVTPQAEAPAPSSTSLLLLRRRRIVPLASSSRLLHGPALCAR